MGIWMARVKSLDSGNNNRNPVSVSDCNVKLTRFLLIIEIRVYQRTHENEMVRSDTSCNCLPTLNSLMNFKVCYFEANITSRGHGFLLLDRPNLRNLILGVKVIDNTWVVFDRSLISSAILLTREVKVDSKSPWIMALNYYFLHPEISCNSWGNWENWPIEVDVFVSFDSRVRTLLLSAVRSRCRGIFSDFSSTI